MAALRSRFGIGRLRTVAGGGALRSRALTGSASRR
jgi:hypothetical protein